jgi:hypothetical protein
LVVVVVVAVKRVLPHAPPTERFSLGSKGVEYWQFVFDVRIVRGQAAAETKSLTWSVR